MSGHSRWALVLAVTMTAGCYDWVPTNVDYVRAHPYETIRVTDSLKQTVVTDHVVVEGNDLLLAPAPQTECGYDDPTLRDACYANDLAQRTDVPRVDFVPNPPRLERHELRAGKTALIVTAIVLGLAAGAAGIVFAATYDNGLRIPSGW